MNIAHLFQQDKWSTEFFGCRDDMGTCFITCCLPCVTFGQIAEILDEGQSSCVTQGCAYGLLMSCSCHWLLSCVYRKKLRAKFGLKANICNGCCAHFCCEPCALCQEHAELKNRGFDPSKGWVGQPNAPPPPQMPPTVYQKMIQSE